MYSVKTKNIKIDRKMKKKRNKFISVRLSNDEFELVQNTNFNMCKTRSKLIRFILLNIPQQNTDKIIIKHNKIEITKKGKINK